MLGQLGMNNPLVDITAADPREEWQIQSCRVNFYQRLMSVSYIQVVRGIQLVQVFLLAGAFISWGVGGCLLRKG